MVLASQNAPPLLAYLLAAGFAPLGAASHRLPLLVQRLLDTLPHGGLFGLRLELGLLDDGDFRWHIEIHR